MTSKWAVVSLVFLLSAIIPQTSSREVSAYSNSYVFVTAHNKKTGQRVQSCANYLQFRNRALPETFEKAKGYPLKWWQDIADNTHICPLPGSALRYDGAIVPLEYRIDDDGTSCTRPYTQDSTSFRKAAQFQEDELRKTNASAALFLLTRGRQFVLGWKDYLFTEFFDPYINESTALPTFFVYNSTFRHDILSVLTPNQQIEDLELRFHRPPSSHVDFSMFIIWMIAMTCVAGGGVWAFHRHKLGKDTGLNETQTSSSSESTSVNPNSFCAKYVNYFAIGGLMSILIGVIMLGYYFRPVLVFLFNLMLVVFGASSVHGCARALLSNFPFSTSSWYTAKMTWMPTCGIFANPLTYTGFASSLLSLSLCVYWYFIRLTPYAFILLDFINVTLCLHILKTLRLPSVKWLSVLMMCMFVYDAIMVFATPLWTKNGCSVMLEVATGMDCSPAKNGNDSGYPLPPVEATNAPEKFPMLMQVMHFDPMISCIDLEVEKGYQMSILGLGDIIIPGYLVTHSFTMNGFDASTRLLYGLVCVIGYGVGLVATFIALSLMRMAQPALIYLVPFTLIPVLLFALCRGELGKVWNGVPMDKATFENEESQLNDSSQRSYDVETAETETGSEKHNLSGQET